MENKKPDMQKINEIFKRIKETGKLSVDDAIYIENHYWDFQMPAFKRRCRNESI